MTKYYDWLLFATLCGVVIVSFIAFFFWLKRKRYTRDKFAFTGFFAIFGLTSFYISTLAMQQSLLSIVLSIISKTFDLQQLAPPTPLNPIEAVVVLIILGGLGKLYLEVYKSWNGLKSIAQHEQEQNKT